METDADFWRRQLAIARELPDEELRRHAMVSRNNGHRCEQCFCCAAVAVVNERAARRQRVYRPDLHGF